MPSWIAVIDDDKTNLKTAGMILSRSNMKVSAFKSAQVFLDNMSGDSSPDLILLDILMPDCDGFEAFTRIRDREKELGKSPVPIVFLTANDDPEARKRGLEMGAVDFMEKPFVPDILVSRVKSIIGSKE